MDGTVRAPCLAACSWCPVTVEGMSWELEVDELPAAAPLVDSDALPIEPPLVPGLESLSPIAASFATGLPSNEVSLRLVSTFQKGRRPGATPAQVRAAEEAIAQLNQNLFRLVLTIAREHVTRRYGSQLVSDMTPDLIQEASVAIVEAAGRFDVSSGGKWSAYAGRAARDRIRSVVTNDTTTTTPASWKRLRRIATTRLPELRDELGRAPSTEELRADLLVRCLEWADSKLSDSDRRGSPEEQHSAKMARLRKQGTLAALDRLDDVMASGLSATSMQAPAGENRTVGDTVADRHEQDDAFDAAELSDIRTRLSQALQRLDQRSRTVVMYRFGFVDGINWTHAALGNELGLSSERVRQLEQEALLELKGVSSSFGLVGLV